MAVETNRRLTIHQRRAGIFLTAVTSSSPFSGLRWPEAAPDIDPCYYTLPPISLVDPVGPGNENRLPLNSAARCPTFRRPGERAGVLLPGRENQQSGDFQFR